MVLAYNRRWVKEFCRDFTERYMTTSNYGVNGFIFRNVPVRRSADMVWWELNSPFAPKLHWKMMFCFIEGHFYSVLQSFRTLLTLKVNARGASTRRRDSWLCYWNGILYADSCRSENTRRGRKDRVLQSRELRSTLGHLRIAYKCAPVRTAEHEISLKMHFRPLTLWKAGIEEHRTKHFIFVLVD